MPRYFLRIAYMGGRYSGFQVQENACTVQGEVERALELLFRRRVVCTGSSRTDAGVHALCNYFHFDLPFDASRDAVYRLNAILPQDVAVRSIAEVHPEAHCRYDAVSRRYRYSVHVSKDPFLNDRSWYHPYPLDRSVLDAAAAHLLTVSSFGSFAKRHGQQRSDICRLTESFWQETDEGFAYHVRGNRFLRGMVRGLVGTMLGAARGRMTLEGFIDAVASGDNARADFSPPGRGLTLMEVAFPEGFTMRAY
jgi:tRNA pseudouridine38-40 synthase